MSGYGKIYESSYWGVGVCDNTIGWGSSYKSIANCTDASFSYPLDSYPTNGTDPTPTITGDAGGTFTATPSGLTLNASTGEITLSTSTVNSYTIRYTLPDTTFAEQSMQITAPPFSSTRSFSFDGVNDYFDTSTFAYGSGSISASVWIKTSASAFWNLEFPIIIRSNLGSGTDIGRTYGVSTNRVIAIGSSYGSTKLNDGNWHHLVWTRDISTGAMKGYVDGNLTPEVTGTSTGTFGSMFRIGAYTNAAGAVSYYYEGLIDEVAYWDSLLTDAAITEIFNSGVPNDLDSLSNASSPTAWYRMGE